MFNLKLKTLNRFKTSIKILYLNKKRSLCADSRYGQLKRGEIGQSHPLRVKTTKET